jgi:hypothetical protein
MKAHLLLFALAVAACEPSAEPSTPSVQQALVPAFGSREAVTITGYTGNAMEPFLSRDGQTLFFNNLNSAPENTNLHYATRVNDVSFTYQGEVGGVNTTELEGVPSMDAAGRFYFTSPRSYTTSLRAIYSGQYSAGSVSGLSLVAGDFPRLQPNYVNMDAEVSASGERLYVTDALFTGGSVPAEADIRIAQRHGTSFNLLSNWASIMATVNTPALEYAPCTSADELQFYFTRATVATSSFGIYVASRTSIASAFGPATLIGSATGPVQEAPTISPDGRLLYYHALDGGVFRLFLLRRTN